jgi:aryl-alcohol dehydrogenase-like predicted oxidoreductase
MNTTNETRLGAQGPRVFPIALGCMGMGAGSWYGKSDDAEGIATIHAALERGVNVIDTGDFYGMGKNEMLVGRALQGRRDKALLSVNVRYISLSEVGAETIRRAAKVHPICDLQIEYSVVSRSPEASIVPVLAELGIAMTAYGVLSRGLLTGSKPVEKSDFRAHMPRFAGANAEKNQPLVEALARAAAAKGVKPAQLAIAWVRAKGAAQNVTIIPTMGARTRAQLADALSALDVALTPSEVASLEAAVPASAIAGERYPAPAMATLDSER